MNIYCDNYAQCNMFVRYFTDDQEYAETCARAKNWHIFHGTTQGGEPHHATLCPQCAGSRRRALNPPPPLQHGQRELFEIMVYTPPA